MWNSFTDKLSLRHKQDYSEKNSHKLEKRWAAFFQDYQNQSVSICVHLCASMLLFVLCCSTVLSGYCNVSLYFLGILGVMKLHHFA